MTDLCDRDDLDLFAVIGSYLDSEAVPELAELERRFWRHKIGELAASQGMSLLQFFQSRIGPELA